MTFPGHFKSSRRGLELVILPAEAPPAPPGSDTFRRRLGTAASDRLLTKLSHPFISCDSTDRPKRPRTRDATCAHARRHTRTGAWRFLRVVNDAARMLLTLPCGGGGGWGGEEGEEDAAGRRRPHLLTSRQRSLSFSLSFSRL